MVVLHLRMHCPLLSLDTRRHGSPTDQALRAAALALMLSIACRLQAPIGHFRSQALIAGVKAESARFAQLTHTLCSGTCSPIASCFPQSRTLARYFAVYALNSLVRTLLDAALLQSLQSRAYAQHRSLEWCLQCTDPSVAVKVWLST